MAISLDTTGGLTITSGGGNTSLTIASGASIAVSVYYNPGGLAPTFTATWNTSENLTQVTSVDIDNASPAAWGAGRVANVLFYILAPTSGTHTLSITDNRSRPLGFSATSYTGVVSVGVNSKLGSTSAGTITHTMTVTANSWIAVGGIGNDTLTAGTGLTIRNSQNSANEAGFDTNGALSAGSNSVSVLNTNNNGAASVALELISQAVSSVNSNFLILM